MPSIRLYTTDNKECNKHDWIETHQRTLKNSTNIPTLIHILSYKKEHQQHGRKGERNAHNTLADQAEETKTCGKNNVERQGK